MKYASFFGLRDEPFGLSPDPSFLYLSPCHREALAALGDGLVARGGLHLLVGDVGTGKTTVVYSMLGRLDAAVDVAVVAHTTQTFAELLAVALADLGVEAIPDSKEALLGVLGAYCRANVERPVVLVIDEAQDLSDEALEEFRRLSTLESFRSVLQIVLVGQPDLEERLRQPRLRPLRDLTSVHALVGPLEASEMERYIAHRLRMVGGSMEALFAPGALGQIVRRSAGIPRRANILCHNALLLAYERALERVTPRIAHEVIAEMDGRRPFAARETPPQRVAGRWPAIRALAIAVLAVSFRPVRRLGRAGRGVGARLSAHARELRRATGRIAWRVTAKIDSWHRLTLHGAAVRADAAWTAGVGSVRRTARRASRALRCAGANLPRYGRETRSKTARVVSEMVIGVGLLGRAVLRRAAASPSEIMRTAAAAAAGLAMVAAAQVGLRGPTTGNLTATRTSEHVAVGSGAEIAIVDAPAGERFCLTGLHGRHGAFPVLARGPRPSVTTTPDPSDKPPPSVDGKRRPPSTRRPAGSANAAGPTKSPARRADRLGALRPVVQALNRVFGTTP